MAYHTLVQRMGKTKLGQIYCRKLWIVENLALRPNWPSGSACFPSPNRLHKNIRHISRKMQSSLVLGRAAGFSSIASPCRPCVPASRSCLVVTNAYGDLPKIGECYRGAIAAASSAAQLWWMRQDCACKSSGAWLSCLTPAAPCMHRGYVCSVQVRSEQL